MITFVIIGQLFRKLKMTSHDALSSHTPFLFLRCKRGYKFNSKCTVKIFCLHCEAQLINAVQGHAHLFLVSEHLNF
jgi:hypothetical protein